MKDLVKKTQFEKDVPFQVLEDIVEQLRICEKEHPEWPPIAGEYTLGGIVGVQVRKYLQDDHEQGFRAIARIHAIGIAVTAIRYLKNHHSR